MSASFLFALCCCRRPLTPSSAFALADVGHGEAWFESHYEEEGEYYPIPGVTVTNAEWAAAYDDAWAKYVAALLDFAGQFPTAGFWYTTEGVVRDPNDPWISWVFGNFVGHGSGFVFDFEFDDAAQELYDLELEIEYTQTGTTWAGFTVDVFCNNSDGGFDGPYERLADLTGTNLVDTFVAAAGGTRTITLQQADILQAGEPLHTWTIIVRPRNNKPPYPGSTGTPPVGTEADGSITVTSMAINYKKRNL